MAKRGRKKKKTTTTKKKKNYMTILYGAIFIIFCIAGLLGLGPVGNFIAAVTMFGFGSLWFFILILLLILGLYLLIKMEWCDFFSVKMIGLYLFIFGLLMLLHKDMINGTLGFKITIDNLVNNFNAFMSNGATNNYIIDAGGGIIGGSFAILISMAFSATGLLIISIVLTILGLIMVIGGSVATFVRARYDEHLDDEEEIEEKPKKKDKKEEAEEVEEEIKEEPKKAIIHNFNDLPKPQVKEEVKEEKVEKEKIVNNENYQLPPSDLLNKVKKRDAGETNSATNKNIERLEKVLKDFGINGKVVEVHIGPTVSQYEVEIASGTRVNKVTSINKEIALALAKKDVRIEAPIPGKSTVGIEFANDNPSSVSFREIIDSPQMKNYPDEKLLVPLGISILGDIGTCKINKMPHMLIAGTTGSGKSVCVNGIICSILMRAKPNEVKLAMVDPKVVELSVYNGIPHLMCPVVTDPKKAAILLAKTVQEMEDRYNTFSNSGTKNIEGYNEYVEKENKNRSEDTKLEKMPYVVVIIDELADLMMVAAKEVEDSILRITQKARAAGIHLIVATQRPSTEVITGLIKANIPSRIAFAVGSGIDSRTILDQTGAEKLLGKGDMLYLPIGQNAPTRIQGSFITDDEIKKLIDWTVSQQKAQYSESFMNLENPSGDGGGSAASGGATPAGDDDDPLYNDIVEFVVTTGKASASLIQRKFKLGYNRAARIVDLLEERGIIGPPNGSKPREVLVQLEESSEEEVSE